MQAKIAHETQPETPVYTPPEGLSLSDGQQFINFIRNTKCTEHCTSVISSYLETGTRNLVALFHQPSGTYYLRSRLQRVK